MLVDVPPGGAVVEDHGTAPLDLALRRFGDGFDVDAHTVAPGGARTITIPTDRSTRPWQLQLTGAGSADVCPITAGGGG
jgi:hypothetical protein